MRALSGLVEEHVAPDLFKALQLPARYRPYSLAGVSGVIRRQAFKYSESEWAHWLMLMAADRVDVVEGVVQDLARGRAPNIPAEMGIRSELAHNRTGLLQKTIISGAVVGLGVLAVQLMLSRRNGRRSRAGR